jgi:outer membrane beta-barrel protein
MSRLLRSVFLVGSWSAASVAQAQESDLPDDFGETTETSVRQEKQALLAESKVALPDEEQGKRTIQTFQKKNFLKIGRYEGSPFIGFVTNDPFVNRYLFGASLAYHVTEVLGVEVSGFGSPDLGEGDYKAVTRQIIENNQVTPDISKIQFAVSGAFQYSPIYGKIAVGSNKIIGFDIFGLFGTGVVNTRDDLEALDKTEDPDALATQSQFHPSLVYGGGLRVIFSQGFAARLEGRGLSFIEVIESDTLEMKNNFTLLASVSLFFPGME